ncbi:MAG: hypothetical protein EP332_14740 [Bacteroidetes bacterium]|nr:MAG: hypothetical protein EP332_14740 [Bacteroidota bacterium]
MRRIFTILLLTIGLSSYAQKSVEVGIMLGGSNYMGELSENRFDNIYFAGGLVGRFNINDYITLKGNAYYGRISGADSNSTSTFSKERNLSFRSELFEFGGNVEWNIFGYNPTLTVGSGKGFTPFLFAGLAVYKYNPKAYYVDRWIELQPLGTEGQGTTQFQDRKKYNLTQFAIPFGGGLKMRLAKNWSVTLEYGLRKTFNDYLDDVSLTYVEPGILEQNYGKLEDGGYSRVLADRSSSDVQATRDYDPITFVGPARGNSKTTDWYAYGGITITYTILGNRVKCYSF